MPGFISRKVAGEVFMQKAKPDAEKSSRNSLTTGSSEKGFAGDTGFVASPALSGHRVLGDQAAWATLQGLHWGLLAPICRVSWLES